jgi:GAF domain-containing protein
VETARTQTLITISDTGNDRRWPQSVAAAQECQVGSMLCAPLWVDECTMGTLTLYSSQPAAFGRHEVQLIEMFAALAAITLAQAQHAGQLREAISSRDLIGQAKGILMERYRMSSNAAFAVLAWASQALNMKLIAVARHLSETGELLTGQDDRDCKASGVTPDHGNGTDGRDDVRRGEPG